MADHNELGKSAEEMAAAFLQSRKYEILYRNWRYSRFEIDIIALKKGKLHIVEVKALQWFARRHPEESVTKKKFRFLLNAADEFLHQHPQYRHVQFDIVSVTFYKDRDPVFFLIEDIYL